MRIQSNRKLAAAVMMFVLGTAPVAMGRPSAPRDRDGVVQQAMLVIRRMFGNFSLNSLPSTPIPPKKGDLTEPITPTENALPTTPIP